MPRDVLSRLLLITLLATTLSGCAVVGGIFKAGVWVGVIMAVFVLALLMWIFTRAKS